MKIEENKTYNKPYQVIVTVSFTLYFSRKEEKEGTEIPHELIASEVNKAIENMEYEVQEESME